MKRITNSRYAWTGMIKMIFTRKTNAARATGKTIKVFLIVRSDISKKPASSKYMR